MAATKEAILAKEHEPGLEVTIFFLDLRAFGKDFDRYCERAKKQLGVRYVRSFISRTYEMPGTRNLRLVYASPEMKQVEEEFDMVVLSLGLEPSASLQEQAERMGVVLNRWGFAQTSELAPLDTSRPGVFVGGAFQEPKDIPDTVMQASAAAARAMALLAPARGSRVRKKTYPPERDIADEPPRVGVFVCHCGSNIASVVDVEAVVARNAALPDVVPCRDTTSTPAPTTARTASRQKIAEHRLNRVVVASCTPRTHEPIFRDTLRDAGPESVPAGNGQHPRPVLLGPFGQSRRRPPTRRSTWCGWPWAGRAQLMPLAAGSRAGQQRRAGRRRRRGRHDGRLGPGRPGLPRPSGGKERRPGRHGSAAPPHARRPVTSQAQCSPRASDTDPAEHDRVTHPRGSPSTSTHASTMPRKVDDRRTSGRTSHSP